MSFIKRSQDIVGHYALFYPPFMVFIAVITALLFPNSYVFGPLFILAVFLAIPAFIWNVTLNLKHDPAVLIWPFIFTAVSWIATIVMCHTSSYTAYVICLVVIFMFFSMSFFKGHAIQK